MLEHQERQDMGDNLLPPHCSIIKEDNQVNIKLEALTLRNFKGITDLSLEFNGQPASIYGTNGVGKTTIYDAWLWLLTGKDSKGAADAKIKPVDCDGEIIDHAARSAVEATILADGQRIYLGREYFERWSKKRGNTEATYDGNTTEFYINGVPKSKTDYEKALEQLVPADKLRILSDLHAFGALPWQKRRDILFELADVGTDLELMSQLPKYEPLLEAAAPVGLDDLRAQLKARRKKLNTRLNDLPVMIGENRKTEQELGEIPTAALEASLADLQEDEHRLTQQIAEAEQGQTGALKTALSEAMMDLRALELDNAEYRRAHEPPRDGTAEEIGRVSAEVDRLTADYVRASNSYHQLAKIAKAHEDNAQQYREMWLEESGKEYSGDDICPTCGQLLPEDKRAQARLSWEGAKRDKLQQIRRLGTDAAIHGQEMREQAEELKNTMAELESGLAERKAKLESLKERQKAAPAQTVEDMPDYAKRHNELEERVRAAQSALSAAKQDAVTRTNDLRQQRQAVRADMDGIRGQLAKGETLSRLRQRITELEEERHNLADELAGLDRLTDLAEDFTRYKAEYITASVNDRFRIARFRLFEVQVNGGLKDCCDILCGGVEYGGGLNTAAVYNTGMDIISTLSEWYGIHVPLFVDNAESVVRLEPIDTQVIRLVVSDEDEKVRMEVE